MTTFRTVNSEPGRYVRMGDGRENTVRELVGVLVGVFENPYGGHNYKFEVAADDGAVEYVTVNGNKALEVLTPSMAGKLVRLEYAGTRKLENGRTFKDIVVQIAETVSPEDQARYPSLGKIGQPQTPVPDDDELPF